MLVRIRRPSKGAHFIHPIDPPPRTAILTAGFRPARMVRVFPQGWNERVKRFQPRSIAAPLDQLRTLARDGWPLEQAIVVFTYAGGPVISAADRESFWKAFGVPVFEQYLSPRNKLLAMECDAHWGLHVVSGCEELPLEHDICACGNRAPRLTRDAKIEELAGVLV